MDECVCLPGEGHNRHLTVGTRVPVWRKKSDGTSHIPERWVDGEEHTVSQVDDADCDLTYFLTDDTGGMYTVAWVYDHNLQPPLTVPAFTSFEDADAFLDDPDRWMEEQRERQADAR
jgi:hypothetical protein